MKKNLEQRVIELEKRKSYLERLLDGAGIDYRKHEEFDADKQETSRQKIALVKLTDWHRQLFFSMFKGRTDVDAKRSGKPNPKTGRAGYYPQCENFWKCGLCPKREGKKVKCSECANQKYLPLRGRVLLNHLSFTSHADVMMYWRCASRR